MAWTICRTAQRSRKNDGTSNAWTRPSASPMSWILMLSPPPGELAPELGRRLEVEWYRRGPGVQLPRQPDRDRAALEDGLSGLDGARERDVQRKGDRLRLPRLERSEVVRRNIADVRAADGHRRL